MCFCLVEGRWLRSPSHCPVSQAVADQPDGTSAEEGERRWFWDALIHCHGPAVSHARSADKNIIPKHSRRKAKAIVSSAFS